MYFGLRNQQNKGQSPFQLSHANIFNGDYACFKHPNFFKVNYSERVTFQVNGDVGITEK
jgi:hypothetical protein